MADKIIITVSFDKGYSEQATVMLYSLLLNNRSNSFTILVFYNDLDDAAKGRILRNLGSFSNFTIEWLKVESAVIKSFNIRKGHVNEYTYTRIFMAHMRSDIERFLYLDCDMLVLGDLSELWKTDLKGKTFGAIEDPAPFFRYKELGIPKGEKYFNAGVLLLDVKKWNENNYTEAVVNKLAELGDKAAWWDQDGLNATLYNEWMSLDKKWNIQSHDVMVAQEANVKKIKSYLSASIVHFTGNLKPWNFKSSNPYKMDYYHILRQTDFIKTHRPENKTTINMARRGARNLFVFIGIMKY